jgi:hypothetical protein
MLLLNIWDMVLKSWKQRNDIVHRKAETIQESHRQERLELQVRRCYAVKEYMNREDRDKIFYMEEQDLIRENHRFIQSWIRLAERLIRTVKKQNQNKSNTRRLMENYVKWQPPTNKKKITASELQPD